MTWLYGSSMFNFLGCCQTAFQGSCAILRFRLQCMRVPMAPLPTNTRSDQFYFSLRHCNRCVHVFNCDFNLFYVITKDIKQSQ